MIMFCLQHFQSLASKPKESGDHTSFKKSYGGEDSDRLVI